MAVSGTPTETFVGSLDRGLSFVKSVVLFLGVPFGALIVLRVDPIVSAVASFVCFSLWVLGWYVWYNFRRKRSATTAPRSATIPPSLHRGVVLAHPDGRTVTIPAHSVSGATPLRIHAQFTTEGMITVDMTPDYSNGLAKEASGLSLSQVRSDQVTQLLSSLLSLALQGPDETTDGILQSLKSRALSLTGSQARGIESFWANWNLSIGDLETHYSRHDRAELAYRQAVSQAKVAKIEDLIGIAEGGVGTALGMQGRSKEALAVFEDVAKNHPTWPDAWYNKGVALSSLGKKAEALDCFVKSTDMDPSKQEAWYNRGNCLFALRRHNEAAVAYRRVLDLRPNRAEAWNNLGAALLRVDKVAEAREALLKAAELKLDYPEAWANLAVAHERAGEHAPALAAIEKAIALGQDTKTQWLRRGQILAIMAREDEALASFDKALELGDDLFGAWLGKANVLFALDRFGESVDAYRRATKLDPTSYEAHYNLGTALGRQGEFENAVTAFDRALELNKDSADCWENRGNALLALGKYDQALESYKNAERLEPRRVSVHVHLGAALLYGGKKDAALLEFEAATGLDPANAMAWYNIGTVHATSGRPEEAIQALSEAWKGRSGLTENGIGILLLALQTGLSQRIRSAKAGRNPNDAAIVGLLKTMIRSADAPDLGELVTAFFDEMDRIWTAEADLVGAFRAEIEAKEADNRRAASG